MLISIQFFRQILSHNSIKAQAAMSISIMGIAIVLLAQLGWGSRCQDGRKENAWILVFKLLPSLTPKYLRLQSIKCRTIVVHNTLRHCGIHFHAFVRQSFSKQLYMGGEIQLQSGTKVSWHWSWLKANLLSWNAICPAYTPLMGGEVASWLSNDPDKNYDSISYCSAATALSPHWNGYVFRRRINQPMESRFVK